MMIIYHDLSRFSITLEIQPCKEIWTKCQIRKTRKNTLETEQPYTTIKNKTTKTIKKATNTP